MKSFFKARFAPIVGVITLAVIIGFSMVGCDAEEEDSTNKDDSSNNNDSITIGNWVWSVEDDSGRGGTSTITMTQGTGTDNNKLTFIGNVTNVDENGSSQIFITPNEAELAKLKTATSISFKAKGDSKEWRFWFRQTNLKDDASYYSTTVTPTAMETTFTINISSLTAPNWGQGKTTPFDQSKGFGIKFERSVNTGGVGPFSITISDLRLDNDGNGNGGTDPALNGTWGYTDNDGHLVEVKFNNGNYESKVSGNLTKKGTYTTSDNKITMTLTHYYGTCNDLSKLHLPGIEEKWYSKNDLKTSFGSYFTDAELNLMFGSTQPFTYSISDNILTAGGQIYTKVVTQW